MRYLPINNSLFTSNRKKFSEKMKNNTLSIFNSNDIMPTNADGSMPFRQNNDLLWLSGIDQEESVLIIYPDNPSIKDREMLFIKKTSELIAIWEGEKLSKESAYVQSGIKSIYWIDELNDKLKEVINNSNGVYLNKNMHARSTSEVETRDDRFRKKIKEEFSSKRILESAPIMHDLRSIKSSEEISLIQEACNITEKGFRRILKCIHPGIMEYEIGMESPIKTTKI